MASTQYLQLAAVLLSFFLKVGVGYVMCLCLTRTLPRPDLRFRVWLAFVVMSAFYWISLLSSAVGHFFPQSFSQGLSQSIARSSRLSAPSLLAPPSHLLVPQQWGHDVMLAGRTVLCLYLGTMVLLACGKAWNHLRLKMLFKLGLTAPADVTAVFNEMRAEYGIARCQLAVLPGLGSPATAYWWTPRIVLPEEIAVQGATHDLVNVFRHEMEHIRRRDYFWSNVTDLICGLLFFHPAIWQARNRMRLERELACDLAVVNARPDFRADYANNLASVVRRRMLQDGRSCGVDFAASASMLGARIKNILAEPVRMPWWKKLSAVATSALLLVAFFVLSPALSVGIDFASSAPAIIGPAAQPFSQAASSHKRRDTAATDAIHASSGEARNTVRGHDSLRQVRSRSYLPETPAYRLASATYVTEKTAAPNWDSPALSERSPATPRIAKPSVTSVVLSTLGQIIIHERSEHRGPGRERDERIVASPTPVD